MGRDLSAESDNGVLEFGFRTWYPKNGVIASQEPATGLPDYSDPVLPILGTQVPGIPVPVCCTSIYL